MTITFALISLLCRDINGIDPAPQNLPHMQFWNVQNYKLVELFFFDDISLRRSWKVVFHSFYNVGHIV